MNNRVALLIAAVALTARILLAGAEVTDLADHYRDHRMIQSISIRTNESLSIQLTNGSIAMIHFVWLAQTGSVYQWKWLEAGRHHITAGSNVVTEQVSSARLFVRESQIGEQGTGKAKTYSQTLYRVLPENQVPKLLIGGTQIEWSYGSETNIYLYIATNRASVQRLSAESFDRGLRAPW